MSIRFINLWKYWKKPMSTKDFDLLSFTLYDSMWGGMRFVLFNVGFSISLNRSK